MGVEQVGDKGKIELGVSGHERLWGQVLAAFDAIGIVEHHFGALHKVVLLEGGQAALVGFQLIQEHGVVFTIGNVFAKVGDPSFPAIGPFEVVVEPSQEDLVRRQAEEFVESFTIVQ